MQEFNYIFFIYSCRSSIQCRKHTGTDRLCAAAMQAFEERSLTDATHAIGHISFLSEVVLVMLSLLERQPISHPAERSSGEVSHSDDNGWDLFPAEVVDAAKPWPTPSVAQWAEIELISCRCHNPFCVAVRKQSYCEFMSSALYLGWMQMLKLAELVQTGRLADCLLNAFRVMVLLEWATEEQQLTRPSLEEHGHLQKLGESLTLLLHQLLLGHMLDEDFDAARIVRCPCCAVLCCLVLLHRLLLGHMLDKDFDAARIVRCPCCAVLPSAGFGDGEW